MISLFSSTEDAWAVMREDISIAKRSICLEQYIFADDSVGRGFVRLLLQKRAEGVEVKIIFDYVGSFGFYGSVMCRELEQAGCAIVFHNVIKTWRIDTFTSNFFRDHRKLLIIDGKVAHISGIGIAEYMQTWRDTHARITGLAVEHAIIEFEKMFNKEGKSKQDIKKIHEEIQEYVITNSPWIGRKYLYKALRKKMRLAQKHIFITTPYFVPGTRFYKVLCAAAKRGVDVRVLTPQKTDYAFINHARDFYYKHALMCGVRFFEYTPTMIHAKTVVVDDWATIGSFNMDNLSFNFNYEINIASYDTDFVSELVRHFVNDRNESVEIELALWNTRSWFKKIKELLTRPFHFIL
jgi:cardiolipin synthase